MTDQITAQHDPDVQYQRLQELTDRESRYMFYLIALGWPPDIALDFVYFLKLDEKKGTSP